MTRFVPGPLQVPAGYGIQGVGTVSWAEVAERLAAARNYWIVTARPDGRPHAAPVWGAWIDDAVWFSTDPASVKGRNLAASSEVVVHLESGDEVVIVEGVAGPAPEHGFEAYREAYRRKYDFEHPARDAPGSLVFAVRPRRVLSWSERSFPRSAIAWTPASS